MEYVGGKQYESQRDRRDDGESDDRDEERPPTGARDLADVGGEADAGEGEQERPFRHVGEVGGLALGQPVRGRDRRDSQKPEDKFREFVPDERGLGFETGSDLVGLPASCPKQRETQDDESDQRVAGG